MHSYLSAGLVLSGFAMSKYCIHAVCPWKWSFLKDKVIFLGLPATELGRRTRSQKELHDRGVAACAGVASALVVLGQYDIVHDEGLKYAKKLNAARVPVTIKDYQGVAHNFPSYSVVAQQNGLRIQKGEAAIEDIMVAFKKAFA